MAKTMLESRIVCNNLGGIENCKKLGSLVIDGKNIFALSAKQRAAKHSENQAFAKVPCRPSCSSPAFQLQGGWQIHRPLGATSPASVPRGLCRGVGCGGVGDGVAAGWSVAAEQESSSAGEDGRMSAMVLGLCSCLGVAALQYLHVTLGHATWTRPLLAGAFITSTLASSLTSCLMLPLLRRLKASQVVREDGPARHVAQKSGTPTMGGAGFVPVGALLALAFTHASPTVSAVAGLIVGVCILGAWDDVCKMLQQRSKGLTPKVKLLCQITLGTLFTSILALPQVPAATHLGHHTLLLPGGLHFPLGVLFGPLAVFVITAESNAVNLTDGLDGLAAGLATAAYLGMAAVMLILQVPACGELAVLCCCMAGAALGFLTVNHHPAGVFMGDTGSLALGAGVGGVAVAGGAACLPPLLLTTLLFAVEALSVIIQVTVYKATKDEHGVGKRVFRMAPFHHHLELCGWSEVDVVKTFYLCSTFLALVGCVVATFCIL